MTACNPKDFLPVFGNEICIITPTFKRNEQLNRLLKTLTEQTLTVGSIIIADGIGDAKDIVEDYQDKLPVKWLNCPVKGQIPQRNYALKELPLNCKIVIYFDDDIQLECDAIKEMVSFWNKQMIVPAGVCFNIINLPRERPNNIFRRLFFMATKPHGKVLKSGYNTPFGYHKSNTVFEWLPGGTTAWRRDVLDTYSISDISSKWAICEDLIFSYPVGKNEPLFLCNEAKVKDIDDVINLGFFKCVERGKSIVLWRLYFVTLNPDLSVFHFYWMNIGLILGYLVHSIKISKESLGYLVGIVIGLFFSLGLLLFRKNIRNFLK